MQGDRYSQALWVRLQAPPSPPSPPAPPPLPPHPPPAAATGFVSKLSTRDQPTACLTLAPELKDTVPAGTDGVWFSLLDCSNTAMDDRQLFSYDPTSGLLTLTSTGSCVALEDPAPHVGTRIVQYSCYGWPTQQWQYQAATRSLRPALNTGLCLSIRYNGKAPSLTNLAVLLVACTVTTTNANAGLAQQWTGGQAGWRVPHV